VFSSVRVRLHSLRLFGTLDRSLGHAVRSRRVGLWRSVDCADDRQHSHDRDSGPPRECLHFCPISTTRGPAGRRLRFRTLVH
jgi:hypothetical protein